MTSDTMNAIRALLAADRTVTDAQIENVLRACRATTPKRKLITAKQAMEILDVSRPTLRSYAQSGLLHQINFSSRKARFDEQDVLDLAWRGNPLFGYNPAEPETITA